MLRAIRSLDRTDRVSALVAASDALRRAAGLDSLSQDHSEYTAAVIREVRKRQRVPKAMALEELDEETLARLRGYVLRQITKVTSAGSPNEVDDRLAARGLLPLLDYKTTFHHPFDVTSERRGISRRTVVNSFADVLDTLFFPATDQSGAAFALTRSDDLNSNLLVLFSRLGRSARVHATYRVLEIWSDTAPASCSDALDILTQRFGIEIGYGDTRGKLLTDVPMPLVPRASGPVAVKVVESGMVWYPPTGPPAPLSTVRASDGSRPIDAYKNWDDPIMTLDRPATLLYAFVLDTAALDTALSEAGVPVDPLRGHPEGGIGYDSTIELSALSNRPKLR